MTGTTRVTGALLSVGPLPGSGSALPIRYALPQGNWWKVRTVQASYNTAPSAGTSQVMCSATLGTTTFWNVTNQTGIPAGSFDGTVTFGVNLNQVVIDVPSVVTVGIPDVVVPGGTTIEVAIGGVDNAGALNNMVLLVERIDQEA